MLATIERDYLFCTRAVLGIIHNWAIMEYFLLQLYNTQLPITRVRTEEQQPLIASINTFCDCQLQALLSRHRVQHVVITNSITNTSSIPPHEGFQLCMRHPPPAGRCLLCSPYLRLSNLLVTLTSARSSFRLQLKEVEEEEGGREPTSFCLQQRLQPPPVGTIQSLTLCSCSSLYYCILS